MSERFEPGLPKYDDELQAATDEGDTHPETVEEPFVALSDRKPTDIESSALEALDTRKYTQEALGRKEVVDDNGVTRPEYTIGGRQVVFRTRQEEVQFGERAVTVPGGEFVLPLNFQNGDAEDPIEYSSGKDYVRSHQADSENNLLVVTNTPEGMLSAASLLHQDSEISELLSELAVDAGSNEYKDPRT